MAKKANVLLLVQVHDFRLHIGIVHARCNALFQSLVQQLLRQVAAMLPCGKPLVLLVRAKRLTCGNNALVPHADILEVFLGKLQAFEFFVDDQQIVRQRALPQAALGKP